MPFINMKIGTGQKPTCVPEDTYLLTIEDAELIEDNKGRNVIKTRLKIENPPEDIPNPPAIFHDMYMPGPEDDAKKANYKQLFIDCFFEEFSIPYDEDGFDLDDFLGKQAELPVGQDQYGDHPPRNVIILNPFKK